MGLFDQDVLFQVYGQHFRYVQRPKFKVSLPEVVALWGDCTSMGVIVADLCYVALFEDFSL